MIAGKTYTVERADTDEKRRLGLGERDNLCLSCAMLFVFDHPGKYAFWMKEMRFSLDIIWLAGNEVVYIERDVSADSDRVYTPDRDAHEVVELNAGAARDVMVGDRIVFSVR
jgi:uncharacterized membrane protein (UPF0127 family)